MTSQRVGWGELANPNEDSLHRSKKVGVRSSPQPSMRFHLSSLRSQFFAPFEDPIIQGWISGMISRLVHRDREILHGLSVRYPAPSVVGVSANKRSLLSFGGFQRRIGTEPVPPSIRAGQCQPPETACALSALSYPLKSAPSTKTVVAIGHLVGPRAPLPNSQCLFQASSL